MEKSLKDHLATASISPQPSDASAASISPSASISGMPANASASPAASILPQPFDASTLGASITAEPADASAPHGRAGGLALAAQMTPEARHARALKASQARWANHSKKKRIEYPPINFRPHYFNRTKKA